MLKLLLCFRRQDESREILLDYQDLLEREQQHEGSTTVQVPSRPPTAASVTRSGGSANYLNRKSKQHKLLVMHAAQGTSSNNRPHTSNARFRPANTSPVSPRPTPALLSSSTDSGVKDGAMKTPRRAQTAGAAMKKPTVPTVTVRPSVPLGERHEDALLALKGDPRSLSSTSADQGDVFFFPVVSGEHH